MSKRNYKTLLLTYKGRSTSRRLRRFLSRCLEGNLNPAVLGSDGELELTLVRENKTIRGGSGEVKRALLEHGYKRIVFYCPSPFALRKYLKLVQQLCLPLIVVKRWSIIERGLVPWITLQKQEKSVRRKG